MAKFRGGRLFVRAIAVAVALTVVLVLPLRWLPPLTTSFMVITRITKPAGSGNIDYRWVPRSAISRQAALAVLASEDQKFFLHHGFDFDSIRDAVQESGSDSPVRGASTLTQQVAKNIFLWPGHNWLRKGLEAWLTLWIEILWPKERILEVYLNIAQFGPTIFGVEAAGRRYFAEPASLLTPGQAASLASVLPNPVRFRVNQQTPFLARRQAWIEWQAGELEYAGLFDARAWQRR